jgi:WD40 repeat protein
MHCLLNVLLQLVMPTQSSFGCLLCPGSLACDTQDVHFFHVHICHIYLFRFLPTRTVLSFATAAGHDGSVIFWLLGQSDALAKVEGAHENQINSLAFHPVGHMMATCEREVTLWLTEHACSYGPSIIPVLLCCQA